MEVSVLDQAVHAMSQPRPEPNRQLNQQAMDLVNKLFETLMEIKPAWRTMIPKPEDLNAQKAQFVRAFVENGIRSHEQVAMGVRQARKDPSDFFPSVGKFVSWCTPDPTEIGLPNVEAAYQEAADKYRSPSKKPWSHPAVYHAGKTTGWTMVGTAPRIEAFPIFKKAYEEICKQAMAGVTFTIPKPEANKLEQHDNGKKVNTEQNKRAGNATLAMLKAGF
ncbi:replication protein P [Neptuniibacter sp.]|uniref:replication protein P n=1 Tax=Neptuniibacter sp. TaxID=1962643 RepID=UPI0026083A18|nr:replication protein P [Neptuniibacter sp.]MCP4596160.1 hypothetical protein [Neptuniibacter sp.]